MKKDRLLYLESDDRSEESNHLLINQYSSKVELWLRIAAYLSLKAPNTKITYLGIINEWCCFLKAEIASEKGAHIFANAKDLHAIAYINWLQQRIGQAPRSGIGSAKKGANSALKKNDGRGLNLTSSTIAKKVTTLRKIYRILMQFDLGIVRNPFLHEMVQVPSRHSGQKRPTEMLDFDLVHKVINTPDVKNIQGRRDRLMLALLFAGGLRRSELLRLAISDVKRSPKGNIYLKLRATKSGRDSDQVIPPWASELLTDFLNERKKEGAKEGDLIFVNYRGKKGLYQGLSTTSLYKLFKKYVLIAGGGENLSPHSARATAITRLLDKGLSHRDVQEFSRHASVQMVEAYDKRRLSVDQNPGKDLDY